MERVETREEKEARHARKAANVQAHRSKIRAQLSRQSTLEKVKGPTQFHCPLVFDNAMPEIPVEPKVLPVPFDTDNVYEYNIRKPPVLEATYAFPLHAEQDVGVVIDIIDPLSYEIPNEKPVLHELDKKITAANLAVASSKKPWSVQVDTAVDWLMAPEVTAKDGNEVSLTAAGPSSRVAAPKPAAPKRQHTRGATRAERILQSFQAVSGDAAVPAHPTKPSLVAVKQWAVLPDPTLNDLNLSHISFDVNPDDKVERQKRRNGPEFDAAATKRRLSASVMASPAGAPPTLAGGRLAHLYLPDVDPAVPTPLPALRYVRDYNLALQVYPKARSMENYVMVLDDSLFVASVAPVKLHAEATKIKAPTRPSHELIAVSRSSGEGGGGGGDDDDSLDFDSDSDLDPPPPPPSVKPVEFDEEN